MSLTHERIILFAIIILAGSTVASPPEKRDCSNVYVYDYKPTPVKVCSAKGTTFNNTAYADCYQESIAYYEKCKPDAPKTLQRCKCSKDYDPVCGIDKTTYQNRCFADCGQAFVVNSGPCNLSTSVTSCMTRCTKEKNPVCGRGELTTYTNRCYAECAGETVITEGLCKEKTNTTQSCMCTTKNHMQFVCASDRRSYASICFVFCARLKPRYNGECYGVAHIPTGDNWMRWATYQVCGTDGKMYENLCSAGCAGAGVQSMIGSSAETCKPYVPGMN